MIRNYPIFNGIFNNFHFSSFLIFFRSILEEIFTESSRSISLRDFSTFSLFDLIQQQNLFDKNNIINDNNDNITVNNDNVQAKVKVNFSIKSLKKFNKIAI